MWIVAAKKHGSVLIGTGMSGDAKDATVFEKKEEAEAACQRVNRDFPGLDATVEEQE